MVHLSGKFRSEFHFKPSLIQRFQASPDQIAAPLAGSFIQKLSSSISSSKVRTPKFITRSPRHLLVGSQESLSKYLSKSPGSVSDAYPEPFIEGKGMGMGTGITLVKETGPTLVLMV